MSKSVLVFIIFLTFSISMVYADEKSTIRIDACEVESAEFNRLNHDIEIAGELWVSSKNALIRGRDCVGESGEPVRVCLVGPGQFNAPKVNYVDDRISITALFEAQRKLDFESSLVYRNEVVISGRVFKGNQYKWHCWHGRTETILVFREIISYQVKLQKHK